MNYIDYSVKTPDPIVVSIREKEPIAIGIDLIKFDVTVGEPEPVSVSIGVMPGLSVELKNVTVGGSFYDHYDGPYTCDPTQESQTFGTLNKIMDENFVVLEVSKLETQTSQTTGYTLTILNE